MDYLWLKALHIISVIAWMAGLLYLPRLFVYHCSVAADSETATLFKVMERRLFWAITTPALVASWGLGVALIVQNPALLSAGWLHTKLTLLVLLTAVHIHLGIWMKRFAADRNRYSGRFYRIVNEVPTVLMIGIVCLAVLKPF